MGWFLPVNIISRYTVGLLLSATPIKGNARIFAYGIGKEKSAAVA